MGSGTEDKVLIVNDIPDQLESMELLLRQSGFRVLTACDGREGLDLAEQQQPDLMICNISMPRLDGIEMCRLIREHAELHKTLILLVSNIRRDSENVIEGLKVGADDYLEAPYDPLFLIAKVERLLERRSAEKALQQSEERFRALIENSTDIIAIWKADGTIKYESPSIIRVLGYQPEELVGRSAFDFIHPDDVSQVLESFHHTFERGEISQNLEYRLRHKDGSWRFFESTSKSFVDESGELVGAVISRDVTERRRTERAIKFQAHLLNTVEQAVIATDPYGRITYWNRFAERLYGWSVAEVIGCDILEIILAQTTRQQGAEILSRLKEGKSWSGEFLVKRKDETSFPALVINSPIYDDRGRLVGIVGISLDITERKQAEENLRQSENQLAEAQHIARVGSWNWNLSSNLLNWSDEHFRILGLQPQAFEPTLETVIRDYIHPEDRDVVRVNTENSLRTLEPFSFYYRVIHPDGGMRTIHSRGKVVTDEQGNPIRAFGTAQDVTELKLAEEQLKISNEKLRALSARLQSVREEESIRIAREIHDEMGGALTGLKMDISWLGKRLSEAGSEAAHEKLKSMAELIDETIQKVRHIATELRPSVLDDLGLAAAIEWQARDFQKRIEIECAIISLQEEITLNPEKATAVFRIFQEMLTNIARHARATLVEVSLEENDANLILKVSDNGRGIKEQEISDTKSLGLLGMRERALAFGGGVEIIGLEGKGTTVKVSIPRP